MKREFFFFSEVRFQFRKNSHFFNLRGNWSGNYKWEFKINWPKISLLNLLLSFLSTTNQYNVLKILIKVTSDRKARCQRPESHICLIGSIFRAVFSMVFFMARWVLDFYLNYISFWHLISSVSVRRDFRIPLPSKMSPPFDESQRNSLVLFLHFRAIWARKKEEILTTIIKAFQIFGLLDILSDSRGNWFYKPNFLLDWTKKTTFLKQPFKSSRSSTVLKFICISIIIYIKFAGIVVYERARVCWNEGCVRNETKLRQKVKNKSRNLGFNIESLSLLLTR